MIRQASIEVWLVNKVITVTFSYISFVLYRIKIHVTKIQKNKINSWKSQKYLNCTRHILSRNKTKQANHLNDTNGTRTQQWAGWNSNRGLLGLPVTMKTERRNYEVGETIYGFDGVNNYRVSTTRSRIYRGKCIIDNRDRAASNRDRATATRAHDPSYRSFIDSSLD